MAPRVRFLTDVPHLVHHCRQKLEAFFKTLKHNVFDKKSLPVLMSEYIINRYATVGDRQTSLTEDSNAQFMARWLSNTTPTRRKKSATPRRAPESTWGDKADRANEQSLCGVVYKNGKKCKNKHCKTCTNDPKRCGYHCKCDGHARHKGKSKSAKDLAVVFE